MIPVAPIPAAPAANQKLASVSITIVVPSAATYASGKTTNYVSAGTRSIAVATGPVGTALPPATVASCAASCTLNLSTPTGNTTFEVTLFDGPNATGNRLSTGRTTQTVLANQPNTVRLALGGVVSSVTIGNVGSFTEGTAATSPLTVTANDAAGYTIVGGDPYPNPIALAVHDTSGAVTLSTQTLNSPADGVSLRYSGAPVTSADVTATVVGTSASSTMAILTKKPTGPAPTPGPVAQSNGGVKFGVFARASGAPPFGMFASPGVLDATKAQNILTIGATWTRMSTSPFFVDKTVFGAGQYDFTNIDTLATWQRSHGIEPVTGIEAGPVQVNATPGTFSPKEIPRYANPSDFATFCTVIAKHMYGLGQHTYTEPGNEVNTNPQLFPNGASDVAAYGSACYRAIKSVDPAAVVYGLELNMDGQVGATAFVKTLHDMGCGPGTCYDGISAHLSIRYPTPAVTTPCYPNPGGDYGVQCLVDLRTASGSPVPIMIGETVTTWPGMVADAATKALSDVAGLKTLAATGFVKYINYANLDECALYPSGYFINGCLIDSHNVPTASWKPVVDLFHNV